MKPKIRLEGRRFGRLLVQHDTYLEQKAISRHWVCQCDCGKQTIVLSGNLLAGRTTSCGCWRQERRETLTSVKRQHKAEYQTWQHIIGRCLNSRTPNYKDYGGRGITVCERWRTSFKNFLADMGLRPSPKHSVDRIDNDKGYEPGNCRWATRQEQNRNRRNNVKYSWAGTTLCLQDWCKAAGLDSATVKYRMSQGYPFETAISVPANGWRDFKESWTTL